MIRKFSLGQPVWFIVHVDGDYTAVYMQGTVTKNSQEYLHGRNAR